MAQADEMDGVRVVMSPAQMAAVLAHRSISPGETMSNRLMGGLEVVGGVLEMVGAGALCAVPEPTGLTKAGCIVFGLHASDTISRGAREVWTGRDTVTLTQQGVTKLAEAMNASPDMARNIGLSVDIGVSFGIAGMLKAVRVASVTAGRINLMHHEATVAGGLGGHTLLKHVGKTDAELRARLVRERSLPYASTFSDLRTAEVAISDVLRTERSRIKIWLSSGKSQLTLNGRSARPIGRVLARSTGKIEIARGVTVVLIQKQYNGMPFYVLTAFVKV